MTTTSELIEALKKADPSGKKEVIISHDFMGYSIIPSISLADVVDGEINFFEDSNKSTCVIIPTIS